MTSPATPAEPFDAEQELAATRQTDAEFVTKRDLCVERCRLPS